MKNCRDQKCGKKQEKDVSKCRKKQCCREQDSQAQIELPGFAGFLTRERPDGLEVLPEGSEQTEQPVNQTTRSGCRTSSGNRSSSMAGRFQTRISDGR